MSLYFLPSSQHKETTIVLPFMLGVIYCGPDMLLRTQADRTWEDKGVWFCGTFTYSVQ